LDTTGPTLQRDSGTLIDPKRGREHEMDNGAKKKGQASLASNDVIPDKREAGKPNDLDETIDLLEKPIIHFNTPVRLLLP
jgi:phosphate uptake regulator